MQVESDVTTTRAAAKLQQLFEVPQNLPKPPVKQAMEEVTKVTHHPIEVQVVTKRASPTSMSSSAISSLSSPSASSSRSSASSSSGRSSKGQLQVDEGYRSPSLPNKNNGSSISSSQTKVG